MTPFWQDDHLTLYGGDCRAVLAELPEQSVHCVVTSPPYWGLRDYGTATWEGGDPACDHLEKAGGTGRSTLGEASGGHAISEAGQVRSTERSFVPARSVCRKCSARRIDSQLGLEPTPEEYVANMVAVFREVRRVLRDDGTLWLNLGDSYNGVGRGEKANGLQVAARATTQRTVHGLKSKDLVGIPWRVAFALQADGWYLRSDIIWSKPNPMPESVTDRPTKAHEYLFLLSKSPRYYFDADAVRESGTRYEGEGRWGRVREAMPGDGRDNGLGRHDANPDPTAGRNLRSVWTIATEPYPGAHFATFPRKLVEPCVKAGTSERGVCPECGAPWVRVASVTYDNPGNRTTNGPRSTGNRDITAGFATRLEKRVETTGWRPSCACLRCLACDGPPDDPYHGAEPCLLCPHASPHHPWEPPQAPVPATVLDPFAGSGTTLLVAQSLGRRGVGIDLNPEYLKQALVRNAQTPLGLVG